jgi:hypothetical protein
MRGELFMWDNIKYMKEYHAKNAQREKEYRKIKYQNNREKETEKTRAYRKAHPEKYKETKRKNRLKYKDEINSYNKQYYEKNKNKFDKNKKRNQFLLNRYGITIEEYDALIIKQDNKCGICNKPFTGKGKRLSIDHVHDETKRIRGLLCGKCNSAIGLF